jgi:hypothetical protein
MAASDRSGKSAQTHAIAAWEPFGVLPAFDDLVSDAFANVPRIPLPMSLHAFLAYKPHDNTHGNIPGYVSGNIPDKIHPGISLGSRLPCHEPKAWVTGCHRPLSGTAILTQLTAEYA